MAIGATPVPHAIAGPRNDFLPWAVLGLGLLAVVVPTYVRLHETLWKQEAYEHGFIVAVLFWWLIWRERSSLQPGRSAPWPAAGVPLFVAGLFLYFVGRSQNLPLFEVSAHLPIFAGLLLTTHGWTALRSLWFPLLFLVFMIPLPGFVTLAITGELKQQVSWMAESLLYAAGYPIARDGVVITIGQYRMLVADACAGLNSIYSLTAMGLLYMYLMQRPRWSHNLILLAAILPVAIAANLLRVLVLILLTFHFGDEAGQGFMHGASGIFLFVVALLLLIALDLLLVRTVFRRGPAKEAS
jgi:exosortase B